MEPETKTAEPTLTDEQIEPLIDPGEASRLLGISTVTLSKLARDGRVRALRYRPDGNHHYVLADILRLRNSFIGNHEEE